jgi:hypothetical protein
VGTTVGAGVLITVGAGLRLAVIFLNSLRIITCEKCLAAVGTLEGIFVGLLVGIVGCAVGICEGALEGRKVGALDVG